MRWFVEVASLSPGKPVRVETVEGATWQAALSQARAARGDEAPLSAFSIEVEANSYRATNPMTRLRYLVRQAPADASLTFPRAPEAAPQADSAAQPSIPMAVPLASPPAAAVPGRGPEASQVSSSAPATGPVPVASGKRVPARTMVLGSSGTASFDAPPEAPPVAEIRASPAPSRVPTSTKRNSSRPPSRPRSVPPPRGEAPQAGVIHTQLRTAPPPKDMLPRPAGSEPPPRPRSVPPMRGEAHPAVPAPALRVAPPPPDMMHGVSETALELRPKPPPRAVERPVAVATASQGVSAPPVELHAAAVPEPVSLPGQVFFERSEHPTARSPLSYRELAVAVSPGSALDRAVFVGRAHLMALKNELAGAPPGRLIRLAVFDHTWSSHPERPPLVTMTWKDWRGEEPEVRYPGHSHPPPPASVLPPGQPTSPKTATIDAGWAAQVALSDDESAERSGITMARPSPAASPSFTQPVALPAMPPADPRGGQDVNTWGRPLGGSENANYAARLEAPAAFVPPPPVEPPATLPNPPSPLARPEVHVLGPPPEIRASRPDDLMTELFEVMHDLHFLRNALEGADFVIDLLREKIPAVVTLVHLYDINSKEFVVVRARAPNNSVLGARTHEGGGIIGAALRSGKAFLISDPASDRRWTRERYAQAGHPSPGSIIAAPVRFGPRYLGALELADHLDGSPLEDAELAGVAYIAQQFGEFVADRGIVLTTEGSGPFIADAPRPR